MPTIHTGVHTPIHNHSQSVHTAVKCESSLSQQPFTEIRAVNTQVQNDHSQAIHIHSQAFHGPLARVMNSSPEGGFITAGLRARLTGGDLARAGQMLAILHRIGEKGVQIVEAERLLRQAMEGEYDPKEVLAELLTVAAACRGEKTYQGKPLVNVAYGAFEGLIEGERRAA